MKKITLLLMIAATFYSGCSNPPQNTNPSMPSWAMNQPTKDGYLYGVGSSKKQNQQLARTAAIGLARDEIARSLNLKVNSMFKNFMQESGIGESAQALEFTESVTKQVASTTLSGTIVKEIEVMSDGTMWALVELNLDDVRSAANEAAKKQEALYNEFKANQSFDELMEAIKEMK